MPIVGKDQFIIELSFDEHDLARLAADIEAKKFPVQLIAGTLRFSDLHLGHQVEVWIERLVRYNRRIHALAKREGAPIQPYKPRDLVNLYVAVLEGLLQADVAVLAHQIIWRQPFSNANHRTTVAALLEEFDLTTTPEAIRDLTHPIFATSKKLLDGSDQSLTDQEAMVAHLDQMRRLVSGLQSIK